MRCVAFFYVSFNNLQSYNFFLIDKLFFVFWGGNLCFRLWKLLSCSVLFLNIFLF